MSLNDAINRLKQPIETVEINLHKTPVLTCIITGKSRPTNRKYIQQKAQAAPGETLDAKVRTFENHYVCKEAVKMSRQGKTVGDIRSALGSTIETPIPVESIDLLIEMNGSRPTRNKA